MVIRKKTFRISSALKDIIGKDLITNDFIAVFELVKNAFDANAKRVDITFDGLTTENPRIIIKDDGKGMDLHDLENKWLFVAYSAKKAGVEDYRDKINSSRRYAGAKGIGRFSCDRLGNLLTIYSKKRVEDTKLHKLEVNWEDFEKDMQKEFGTVDVGYSLSRENPFGLKRGTTLVISDLREEWDRKKLLALKRSLEKLINPNQDNDSHRFSVYLNVQEESEADNRVISGQPWEIVNGKICNFIFEALKLKTTQITTTIADNGSEIVTRLSDRGEFVYEIHEDNPFEFRGHKLHDIEIHLFCLNRSAKSTFTRHMGIESVKFGSVFLYKNGFRIHPSGEIEGGDIFALDRRKQQGQSRYLGTRDLIGRVEINGENPEFQETSSRDGGLIKNGAFDCLRTIFMDYALKRLEKYAVDVIKFGNSGDLLDKDGVPDDVKKSVVMEIVESITTPKSARAIKYNPRFLDIVGNVSEKSLNSLLRNFTRIAAESNQSDLERDVKRARLRLLELEQARMEAEKEAQKANEARAAAEKRAAKHANRARTAEKKAKESEVSEQRAESQVLFLRSLVSEDLAHVVSLHHHVGTAANTIDNLVDDMMKRLKSGKAVTAEDFKRVLEKISYQAKKISTTTKFATKANFVLKSTKITADLCVFVQEYVLNICKDTIKTKDRRKNIQFKWKCDEPTEFESQFKPLEITIILDNLISNSRKAGASEVNLSAQVEEDILHLTYEDNGSGIKEGFEEKLFDLGFTTTAGSGLGMYQVADILRQIGGNIQVVNKNGRGAKFRLRFRRL